jgi:hypothetical protein
MLPHLRSAVRRLAIAAATTAASAQGALVASPPLRHAPAAVSKKKKGDDEEAVEEKDDDERRLGETAPAVLCASAADSFFRSYDDLCRGLQPRFAARRDAARETAEREATKEAAWQIADDYDLPPQHAPPPSPSLAQVQALFVPRSEPVLPETEASGAPSDEAPGREVMSNLEVQVCNALAFSLLRLASTDLPTLDEAAQDLCERHRLFVT